jgi:AmpD protein
MEIKQRLLPEFCYSAHNLNKIDGIVLHYFSGRYAFPDDPMDTDKCYNLFIDLNRPASEREFFKIDYDKRMYASAHYMIARDGEIIQLVPLSKRAHHAGESELNGRKHCNSFTVGIEMIATPDSGYTDEQYFAVDWLCTKLMNEHNITKEWVAGHEDVAPGRKFDPGKLFEWDRLSFMHEDG